MNERVELSMRPDKDTPEGIQALARMRKPRSDYRDRHAWETAVKFEELKIALTLMMQKGEPVTYVSLGRKILGNNPQRPQSPLAYVRTFLSKHPEYPLGKLIAAAQTIAHDVRRKTLLLEELEGIGISDAELAKMYSEFKDVKHSIEGSDVRLRIFVRAFFRSGFHASEKESFQSVCHGVSEYARTIGVEWPLENVRGFINHHLWLKQWLIERNIGNPRKRENKKTGEELKGETVGPVAILEAIIKEFPSEKKTLISLVDSYNQRVPIGARKTNKLMLTSLLYQNLKLAEQLLVSADYEKIVRNGVR